MNIPDQHLTHLLDEAFNEDVGDGDHSSLACIPPSAKGRAALMIKEAGMLAGLEVAERIFNYIEPASLFTAFKKDGDRMQPGEKAFIIDAHVHTILKCERLVLNCMQRMSGIATLTAAYAEKLKGYKAKLLDTRKTTPNFRLLEKEAVRIGGGMNHRFGLFDMIMLKDNHIDFCGGVEKAIDQAAAYVEKNKPGLKIEVETRNLEEVQKVMNVGKGKVFRIMLDNFKPAAVADAVRIIDGSFETEASGGINLDNIVDYAKAGVDFVSVGGLIHQARSLDLSLKAIPDPSSSMSVP